MTKKTSTGYRSTGDCSTGYRSTGYRSTGDCSTGDYSTGYRSTGDCSTGDCSTGDCSTGNWSTGYRSTGYRSTGNWSTGDCSTGDCSTGDCSTGDWSTGYRSTGYRSTGDWSISNYSTGHFSTINYSGFGAFNKPCTLEEWSNALKPSFLYFKLTEWVSSDAMTEEEKTANPTYKTTDGYLKNYDYKAAFQKAYDSATEEEKALLLKLPNFDAEVFKEISGIDLTKKETTCNDKVVEIDGKKYKLQEMK